MKNSNSGISGDQSCDANNNDNENENDNKNDNKIPLAQPYNHNDSSTPESNREKVSEPAIPVVEYGSVKENYHCIMSKGGNDQSRLLLGASKSFSQLNITNSSPSKSSSPGSSSSSNSNGNGNGNFNISSQKHSHKHSLSESQLLSSSAPSFRTVTQRERFSSESSFFAHLQHRNNSHNNHHQREGMNTNYADNDQIQVQLQTPLLANVEEEHEQQTNISTNINNSSNNQHPWNQAFDTPLRRALSRNRNMDHENYDDVNLPAEIRRTSSYPQQQQQQQQSLSNSLILAADGILIDGSQEYDNDNNDDDDDYHNHQLTNPLLSESIQTTISTSSTSTTAASRKDQRKRTLISAAFLRDYEHSRPSSLPSNISSISGMQLFIHNIRFSILWQVCLYMAVGCMFFSSCFEGHDKNTIQDEMEVIWRDVVTASNPSKEDHSTSIRRGSGGSPRKLFALTAFSIVIFSLDMIMRSLYSGRGDDYNHDKVISTNAGEHDDSSDATHGTDNRTDKEVVTRSKCRKKKTRWWKVPMIILLISISVETTFKIYENEQYINYIDDDDGNDSGVLKLCIWTGILKPIVFFYVSSKARDAISALWQVASIVARIIIMELFIILSFAAIACHLYFNFSAFKDLPNSFKSLFELSTTAVTPSIWIAVYNESRSSAFFFVSFIIIVVFYLHSLVLSVVFQTYIQAMRSIRERALVDKSEALKLAFIALIPQHEGLSIGGGAGEAVQISQVRKVLSMVRPHYNFMKIDALVQIVDDAGIGIIDLSSFLSNIPKALNTSLRSTRHVGKNSVLLKTLSSFAAITNLIYVLILSSTWQSVWWEEDLVIPTGTVIVLLCIFEIVLRLCLCYFLYIPTSRVHGFLDGLAVLAGIASLYGILLYPTDHHKGFECLLFGRAIDMIRVMRLSDLFSAIINRTGEVLPALVGPIALVFSSLHIFTYIGMFLWGGAVTVGKHDEFIPPLYDLNNFNCYTSGLLTMFNIFVVNDWQAIANVFVHAERWSSPVVVYSFFITANLVGVSILMNVLTAFFVGAFVTKIESNAEGENEGGNTKILLRMTGNTTESQSSPSSSDQQEGNPKSEKSQFRVLQRQGYDDVVKIVTGDDDDDDDGLHVAKKACETLDLLERLTPKVDPTAYLICYHESQGFFGNKHFISKTKMHISETDLQEVVTEMYTELTAFPSSSSVRTGQKSTCCLERTFSHLVDDTNAEELTLSASLIQEKPPVALFVAKTV